MYACHPPLFRSYSAATEAGANIMSGPELRMSDPEAAANTAYGNAFKAAEARYTDAAQVDVESLRRWLGKARDIQWDYKNLVKRKGRLERLK